MSKSALLADKVKLELVHQIRSSPNDLLAIDYARYTQHQYKTSLTTPGLYFEMREKAELALTDAIIGDIFNKIYILLREGKIGDDSVTGGVFVGYPSNLVNEKALSICDSLKKVLNECIEIILPKNNLVLSSQKLIAQTNAL